MCSFVHVVRLELLLWFIKYSKTFQDAEKKKKKSNLSWKACKRVEMGSPLIFLGSYNACAEFV
jgi:hypothetical protein